MSSAFSQVGEWLQDDIEKSLTPEGRKFAQLLYDRWKSELETVSYFRISKAGNYEPEVSRILNHESQPWRGNHLHILDLYFRGFKSYLEEARNTEAAEPLMHVAQEFLDSFSEGLEELKHRISYDLGSFEVQSQLSVGSTFSPEDSCTTLDVAPGKWEASVVGGVSTQGVYYNSLMTVNLQGFETRGIAWHEVGDIWVEDSGMCMFCNSFFTTKESPEFDAESHRDEMVVQMLYGKFRGAVMETCPGAVCDYPRYGHPCTILTARNEKNEICAVRVDLGIPAHYKRFS